MKAETRTTVYLDVDECKTIISSVLGINKDDVIKTKYGFGIVNLSLEQVKNRMENIERF